MFSSAVGPLKTPFRWNSAQNLGHASRGFDFHVSSVSKAMYNFAFDAIGALRA
jgi:hypothetical protein